ncbi:hypothetical protein [Sphingobacterium sp.]|uniref:hypothetical protein n=1 Tax=Sphingobacterium sp. TaxID=341027 RepID=UPI0028A13303|nr:hypothetical protein [Sphingobacterium sp.]
MLKYIFDDIELLEAYYSGSLADLKKVKRNAFLKKRDENRNLTDHYYRLEKEKVFNSIHSFSDLFSIGIRSLSESFLEIKSNIVSVRNEKFFDWQDTICHISPLLFLSYRLESCLLGDEFSEGDLQSFYIDYILPNTKYTCLVSPNIIQLDAKINQWGGLHDLHMHLNGTLEFDIVWQDLLANPIAVYKELKSSFRKNEMVLEQLRQESFLLTLEKYTDLLRIANRLRQYFFLYFKKPSYLNRFDSKECLLSFILDDDNFFSSETKGRHPFLDFLHIDDDSYKYSQSVECLMHVLIIKKIKLESDEVFSNMYHFYQLISGLSNRLLVQQKHQKGFEQFQKITYNRIREYSESKFFRRFYQLNGNKEMFVRHVEGRLSPKDSSDKFKLALSNINQGWQDFNKNSSSKVHELKLLVHFIKKEEKLSTHWSCRYDLLRKELAKKVLILRSYMKNNPGDRDKVVGIDAASSEFDTPPEVFAPSFRMLRNSGFKHFTFHAGEDFHHILGGIRAIYEAIKFCGLSNGDRIGHATAIGISSTQWLKEVGSEIYITKGDYFDDLVFCYHIIVNLKIDSLKNLLPIIIHTIQNLAQEIYGGFYTIGVIEGAWLLRSACPFHNSNEMTVENIDFEEQEFTRTLHQKYSQSKEIYEKFHTVEIKNNRDEIIVVSPSEIFLDTDIELIQKAILKFMNENEIVIETLPTSNVRIGIHKDFSTYHLWNWIRWKREGESIPPIVLGTDDPGIFATNIYNEYASVYLMLIQHHHISHSEAIEIISEINENSLVYRFT